MEQDRIREIQKETEEGEKEQKTWKLVLENCDWDELSPIDIYHICQEIQNGETGGVIKDG